MKIRKNELVEIFKDIISDEMLNYCIWITPLSISLQYFFGKIIKISQKINDEGELSTKIQIIDESEGKQDES